MTIKAMSCTCPPSGQVIEVFSKEEYRTGEFVPLENIYGEQIGQLQCLGPIESRPVPLTGVGTRDVARQYYKFQVL